MLRTSLSSTGSPRDSSRSRNPWETIVSTTSFTVPPSWDRTDFTSLSRTRAQLHTRCGPIGPVSEDDDAGRAERPIATIAPAISRATWRDSRGLRAASRRARSCSLGSNVRRVIVRSTSSAPRGSGAGSHGATAPAPAALLSSNIIDIRSVAATPSTMQWCTFDSSAQWFSLSPSTIHSSHSGLPRSSCWENSRAASFRSCASVPGFGIAVWRR